jgi:hypothetical protein
VASRAGVAVAVLAAAAGVSVLAAYANLLPRPVQQLAHVAVAAPAPASSAPSRGAGSLLTGNGGRTSPPSSPGQTPGAPPGPDYTASHASQPQTSHSPTKRAHAQLPVRATTSPSCPPSQKHSGQPGVQAPAQPTEPAWWQALRCGVPATNSSLPAPKFTTVPHLP